MSKSFKRLSDFFRTFPAFTYNPKRTAELEFCRLWDSKGWRKSDPQFKIIRRQFLKTLVAETGSPVHSFFVNGHAAFDYDSGASPKREFQELRLFYGWRTPSRPQANAARLFEKAFEEEFTSQLDKFFLKFRDFDYNPRESPKQEFRRLKGRMRWKRPAYEKARDEFFRAFVAEFSSHFGADEREIKTWESLCKALGVDYEPPPKSINDCKNRLGTVHVNIFDLVHHVRSKAPFDFFDTEGELREYTIDNDLRFPKDQAKAGPLKFILRSIDVIPTRKRRVSHKAKLSSPILQCAASKRLREVFQKPYYRMFSAITIIAGLGLLLIGRV